MNFKQRIKSISVTKDQWLRIGGIVLYAFLAILAVLGWVLPVPAPFPTTPSAVTRFTSDVWLQNSSISVDQLIKSSDGSVTAPSFTYSNDTNTGLYRIGSDNIGVAIGGSLVSDFASTGLDMNSLPAVNIGNSGTDFTTAGGLTLAGALTPNGGISAAVGVTVTTGDVYVTLGDVNVAAGDVTVTAGHVSAGGNITATGALVGATTTIGGGYGSSGCSGTAAGAWSCDDQILGGKNVTATSALDCQLRRREA